VPLYSSNMYRRATFSYQQSVNSIAHVHNETANIWSHLIGAGLFFYLLTQFYVSIAPRYELASSSEILVISIFYAAVVVCFILSSTFHTFSDHSPHMHRFGNELDHLGVVFVIWGSGVPSDYFGFYCSPRTQYLYWTAVTATALACAIFTLRPKFRHPTYRTTRFLMYCFLGVSLFIPVAHGIIINGWEVQNQRMSLKYFFGLGFLNFLGAAIYAARIPERWFPGKFDIWGSSHQIMHVLVVCGAISHLNGLLAALDYFNGLKVRYGGDACLGV